MKRVIFAVIMLISLNACNRTASVAEISLQDQMIGITSVHNARQLGGYIIGDKQIKENLLIRSARLSSLSEADSTLLADKFRLQRVYDFRGNDETQSAPDVIPGDAAYLSLALSFASSNSPSVHFETEAERIAMLLENAENPLVQELCNTMYDKIFFEDLASIDPDNGAVLWHCTQGKDRAGSASAMLLAALGAERSLIMADFELSKSYYDSFTSNIKTETEAQRHVISTLISVNPVVFEKTLDKVDAEYGSLRNYLTQCLGVTDEMMETLREKFLK
ncbi:MAG: tyrosine-protein phosphatase [Bacteroidales bacterium]|nr:tyrosine-protein phosphatase [Bacteroidales bacterium]